MKGLSKVSVGEGGIALTQHAVPEAGPGEIRLKVAAAGICGTDMQIYHWAPRMARKMQLPRILGHEVSGVIDQLGTGVDGLSIGDHVSLESHIYCGTCYPCMRDRAHLCEKTGYPGITINGAFADYVVVPANIAWPNPKELPHEIAAMLEPFGIAVHACMEGSGVAGQRILINGCGPIGLMAVAAARALGAEQVIASDPNPLRRTTAEQMGADYGFDPTAVELPAAIGEVTNGNGVDAAIEFSGQPQGFLNAMASVTKGGDFRLVGAPAHPMELDLTQWLLRCPRIINIHGRRIWKTWEQATPLIYQGRVDLRPVMSHQLPLSEGARGFELIIQGAALKPILLPQ
ncbi:MAG: alcohol dehydrogenase catalytic domain-containing protein [Rhodospirillaceae bacterium]|jgi:threonine 3-dehydrogenase|nr:alcohol dehydrogenase catalytic domain-containing protein [Rhodospirillaceae bacterium]MBT4043076.1 alcohol dehydrogenase catalytic domain-containing protein [Rhodospirillaceae bacterium]MBT4688059.1 alcohol dehydrogenase catalytic domain-containing protein [Rhodospirillaceae bacterium]MBT5081723.1 alcohol dehydrogenase catalytic domain-containing protein [Rhodospirillaceae bacterium]MBT5527415.1 alcohol dehydrogenase catalytic domain-containing protein [Rhodospirillaceae bacterium]